MLLRYFELRTLTHGSREPTPTLLELGRVANNPAHDGGVRNHNAALRHHRGQISVTQLVRDVPAHRQNYDLGVDVPPQIDRITLQRLGHQSLPRRPPPYYTPQMHQIPISAAIGRS